MPFGRTHPGPAIGQGAGIGRIFEHRRHCGNNRALPAGLSIAVPPRQAEAALVQRADHPNSRAALEEGIKHQCDAGLDLQVRGLRHNARGIPDEPDRQRQIKASSPRSALANRPAVSRLRIVCNSSSEMVPFRPSRSLPFGVPGS
jgi:hypothetical protein